jgi:hypothetical protein
VIRKLANEKFSVKIYLRYEATLKGRIRSGGIKIVAADPWSAKEI